MEFRKIQMFVEVVRQQGFSRAAEHVFTTQSTISKAVRQLEDEVGAPLLDRSVRGVALTPEGEVVYRRGLRLLAEQDDMLRELAAIQGVEKGTLRLGMPGIGGGALFAPVFTEYRKRFPGIDIRLVEHGSDQLEEILRIGDIEFAASLLPVSQDFEWLPVRREPLVALIAPSYEQAARRSMTFNDLRDVPFILLGEGFTQDRIILGACHRWGFEPTVVAKSGQICFLCELAASGLGVAFLPRLVAEQRSGPGVRLVKMEEPDTDWDMAVTWRKGAFLSPAARAWLDLVREIYGHPQLSPL
ncbi:MAG: hypothetical protein PWQ57_710 [Desulfovibrionales bacterium]|nr:hypothetical protein [Desulfovibrionales bacterium]